MMLASLSIIHLFMPIVCSPIKAMTMQDLNNEVVTM